MGSGAAADGDEGGRLTDGFGREREALMAGVNRIRIAVAGIMAMAATATTTCLSSHGSLCCAKSLL